MTPAQTAIVARRTVEGVPSRAIAGEIGISHTTVNRTRQKPEIRAYVEAEIENLITKGLKQSRRTLCRLAAMGNVKDQDKDSLKLALDASKAIMGYVQAQPGSIFNTLIQINQAPEQTKELAGIAAFLATQWQAPVIDLQPTDSDNRTTVQNVNERSDNRTDGQESTESDNQIIIECKECEQFDGESTGIVTPHTPLTSQTSQMDDMTIDYPSAEQDSGAAVGQSTQASVPVPMQAPKMIDDGKMRPRD